MTTLTMSTTTATETADRTRLMRSSLIALAFWLVVVAGLAFVPFARSKPPEREYSTVRLTLNELPRAAASVEVAASTPAATAPAASAKPATPAKPAAPALSRSAISRSAQAASKAAAQRATSAPTQSATAGGLGIPNFSTPVTGSTRSETSGEYLDFQSDERLARTDSAAPANASSASEFEGVAAPLSTTAAKNAQAAGTATAKAQASGETVSALGEIAGAARQGTAGSSSSGSAGSSAAGSASSAKSAGSSSATSTSTASASSSLSALSFEGAARKLLHPATISIVLPDDLARLVTSSRTVAVTLTIRADGSVPSGLVEFTPSAVLPARVRDWLAREFSSWRFEKAAQDGQARFSYSIKVE